MSVASLFYCLMILLGSLSIIFMVMNAINGLRDCMKMSLFARIAKESTCCPGKLQMYKFGVFSMIYEGDTMRASSAILGFTNGRVISRPESVVAMLAASSWKAVWIWMAGALLSLSTILNQSWVLFSSIGFIVILLNISYISNLIGKLLFYTGMLLLSLQLSSTTLSTIVTQFDGVEFIQQYTMEADAIGILFSAFTGIFIGAAISGNLLSAFVAMIFVLEGVVCPECAIAFLISSEIGTLFPMSFMVAGTNHQTRTAFLCFSIVECAVLLISIILLCVIPFTWLSDLSFFGLIFGYTLLFSVLLPIIYYLIGTRLWSKVNSNHAQLSSSKRHLYQFDKIYRPHVSLMLIQAEKEIVNLQYRIHKMLDFILDIIDEEDMEVSLNHVRKYKDIVFRTANEITDFIISQTSEKNNDHVSALAKERIQAVSCQCQLGSLFSDLAETVYQLDKENSQIIRRCIVALETMFNQATKLIDMRYSSSDVKVFDDNVEMLSLQLTNLLKEYAPATYDNVFSYVVKKSRNEIVEIINKLK